MVRFIFVCMGVVALSILTVAGQFIMDGLDTAQEQVAARNDETHATEVVASEAEITAEDLNAIETAAGADAAIDAPGNQTFGDSFTNEAPNALREPVVAMEADTFPTEGTAQ